MSKTSVAIIGSGNIGTDLMIKIMRLSSVLEMGAMVGIDPESDGLTRAERLGVADDPRGHRRAARDARVRRHRDRVRRHLAPARTSATTTVLRAHGKRVIDLTPGGASALTPSRRSTATPISTRRTSTW